MNTPYRRIILRLEDEPEELQSRARRYNPASVLRYKGRSFVIKSGSRDDVAAWSFDGGKRILVLSYNSRMGYAGVEEFHQEDGLTAAMLKKREGNGESRADVFVQNVNEDLRNELGEDEDFFDLSESHQRDILVEYLS